MLKKLIVLLLITRVGSAADSPKRIEQKVADQNLINKVEPTVPPLAKTLEIGGTVELDIIISPEGKISSVTVLSGHPMLAPAFVDAVKKWEYKPFTQDGQAIAVVTKVEWSVPALSRTNAEQKALKDYYPTFSNLLSDGSRWEELRCREEMLRSCRTIR